jgi:hypothetical protein
MVIVIDKSDIERRIPSRCNATNEKWQARARGAKAWVAELGRI